MQGFDATLLAYLDSLRTWGIAATVNAYGLLDLDRIDATFPVVEALCRAVYGVATAETLTATDEYMTLKAAAAGSEYVASWQAGDRIGAPNELPSGFPFQQWMSNAPAGMKRAIANGAEPKAAADLSMRRTVNEVTTTVYQRPRETTYNRFLVDALVARDEPIPVDLTGYYREVETYANLWDGTSRREYRETWERWRRVPSPGACDWCLMLATRSNYTSADAAMYAGGGEGQTRMTPGSNGPRRAGVQRRRSSAQQSGSRYHRSCRCTVAMAASGGQSDEGTSIQMDRAELDRLVESGRSTVQVGNYSYDLTRMELFEGAGIPLPERAPWADAWSSAPRKR